MNGHDTNEKTQQVFKHYGDSGGRRFDEFAIKLRRSSRVSRAIPHPLKSISILDSLVQQDLTSA